MTFVSLFLGAYSEQTGRVPPVSNLILPGVTMPSVDDHLAVHANAIVLRSKRAELLASNLANADTPGYRAKDINFSAVLNQTESQLSASMKKTHRVHLGASESAVEQRTYFRDSPQKSLDENTVDTEYERAQFADNSVRYQVSVQFINSRISGLLRAIRGE